MAFLEAPRFPDDVSRGSRGGPGYSTGVVALASGFEYRNANWASSRYTFDVSYGIKTIEDLEAVIAAFHVANGMADGFRYKDWTDYKSCAAGDLVLPTDQSIGTGDASETDFQLVKIYTRGASTQSRTITKPVPGTVRVALAGVEQTSGWTVDTATGIVTFSVAPGLGVAVAAGFEFDVPVRFNSDTLPVELACATAGGTEFELVEIRI